jgi:hypothetical protein
MPQADLLVCRQQASGIAAKALQRILSNTVPNLSMRLKERAGGGVGGGAATANSRAVLCVWR